MKWFDPVLRWFEAWIDPFEVQETYQPPPRLHAYVWFYVRQAKGAFLALMIFGFISALVEAAMFSYVGQLVDILAAFDESGGRSSGWQGLLADFGPVLLSMVFVVAVLRLLIVAVDALIEEQAIVPGFFVLMRWQGHRHVIGQSLSFFQNDLAGRIAQKVFQSGVATGDMMISLLQVIWFILVYAMTTTGVLLSLDWQLGLIVLVWMASFYFLARYFVPRIREHARLSADTASAVTGQMVDAYANIQTVKLHRADEQENDGVLKASKVHRKAIFRFTRVLTGLRISANLINGIALSAIGIIATDMWLDDRISLGTIAFVLALSLRLRLLFNRLLGNLNGIFRNLGITQNTMELVAQSHGIVDADDAKPFKFSKGDIRLSNVSFHYEGSRQVLKDISLHIRPGEKVGIVGPSGAGKTTLVNLLMRFFEPQSGRIRIDSQDIREVTQDSLRASFSLVQQDTQLFHAPVLENIAYGVVDPSQKKIETAAKLAKAHDFITELADAKGATGYQARVGERGVKLSGGQRQRIAIARAFYRDAPILVLDEATSQLDSGVEEAIQENLSKLFENKTVIVIAHRLSTLARLDRLIVLEQGKIIDDGSHVELMNRGGLYADLWTRQTSGSIATE